MAAKDGVILRGVSLLLFRDKTGTFGNTTLTAAASAGGGTLTVAAITNFAVGEWIRVGSGETQELVQIHTSTAPAGVTITLQTNLRKDHATGEAVVERLGYDLGSATDQGATIRYRSTAQNVGVWDSRLPHAVVNGFVDVEAEFAFPNHSLYSWAAAIGALLALVKGSGTTAQPLQLVTDGTDFNGDTNFDLVIYGKRFDNTDVVAYLFGCDADFSAIGDLAFTRGQLTPLPTRFIAAAGGAFDIGATLPAFAGDTTNKPTKGKVFDALVQAGIFEDAASPAATTVASQGAAGTNTFTLASGTGLAVGDWMRFGTGNLMEIWQLDSINTGTGAGTIRGLFYRTQTGAAAKKQSLTNFAGIDQDGAKLSVGGNVDRMYSAISRTSIGGRPGLADVAIACPVIDTSLVTLARALGIPQAQIVSNRLVSSGGNVLTSTEVNGLYLRGVTLDGLNFVVMGWGTSIDLSNAMELLVNNNGKPATVSIVGKPSAGLALLVY